MTNTPDKIEETTIKTPPPTTPDMNRSWQAKGGLRHAFSIVGLDTSAIGYVIFIQGIKQIATLESIT